MTEKKIKGRTLRGEPREYTFNLMSAKTAFKIMHEFSSELQLASPMLVEKITKDEKPGEFISEEVPQESLELIQFIPLTLKWEQIENLNKEMLSGARIKIGEQVVTLDQEGFGEIDTFEAYTALFFAVVANYEPIVAPLLVALGKQGGKDTSPNTDQPAESS